MPENYNVNDTSRRLTAIYNLVCQNPAVPRPNFSGAIYNTLSCDPQQGTYFNAPLLPVPGQTYSNGRQFIPDRFISQKQDNAAYNEAGRAFNPQTHNQQFRDAYNRIIAEKNPDTEYNGTGDYFHLILNTAVRPDERIIVNLAAQQQALVLALDIAAQHGQLLNEVKFLGKTPPAPPTPLKCDKVVIYYAKGAGNAHRNTLLGAVQNIVAARGLQTIDSLSAFYHKEAPGIGYGIELGNPSFTERNRNIILDIITGARTFQIPVRFDGTPLDCDYFIKQCFTVITPAIE